MRERRGACRGVAGRGEDCWQGSPAVAWSGGGGEELRRWRGAAARSDGEELGAHDRGGERSSGAAVQDKGYGQSLTSQVQPAAVQPAA